MNNENNTLAAPEPSAWMLAGNKGFGVGREKLDETLQGYTEQQISLLLWWFETARERSWKLQDLAQRVGIDSTTLSRVYRGVYGAGIGNVIATLTAAKEAFGDSVDNPDFIMTSLARRMFAIFDKTRALRTVTILWGKKGIGKSTIEEEYTRRNNHGRTYCVRCPGYGPTRTQFVREVAKSMGVSVSGNTDAMRDKIGKFLSKGNRLLIVDELHEVFRTSHAKEIVRICEWLRQLYDEHGMGLALTGTELIQHEFFEGKYSDVLDQLVDRGTIQAALPEKPTKKDVVAFLEHYDLQFPEKGSDSLSLLNDILAAYGLRKLTLHLRDGMALANKRGETNSWKHFNDAFQAIHNLSLR